MKKNNIRNTIIVIAILAAMSFKACQNESHNNTIDENLSSQLDTLSSELISEEIRKNPENALLFAKRAEAYVRESNVAEAINDLNIALKLDSMNSDFYVRLSELYLITVKSEEAKKLLDKCIRLMPDNTDAMLKLAELYLFVGDFKHAAEHLMNVEKMEPQNPKVYFLKGMTNRQMHDTTKAIENLRIAIEKDPDYYDAYILLGLSCAENGDSLAETYYKTAIKLKPESIEAHYDLAMYYQENEKYQQAFDEYNYIINNIDNHFINAYYNIGYINLEYLKNYDEAIVYFSKVIDFEFSFVEAYYNRGLCFEMKGDKKNAIIDYQTCLKLQNNYELAIEGLNRIEKK